MKSGEGIMQILEAYDLTGSFRDAAELVGCSHHTVQRYVREREQQRLTAEVVRRVMLIDAFLPKLEEWVERSRGKLRADVAHRKLVDLGYQGSERTTRRAVAETKSYWTAGRVRVHRPWVPEPGMWMQYDFGDGPPVLGAPTQLFCGWLAWSRYRVVVPILDKTLPTVISAIDIALRRVGGAPTYLLTDNEKTVTVEHVAGIPVRHPQMVAVGRHYGLTIHTCQPADAPSKGGSEATVKIAKADLVPTAANLHADYTSFAELETACARFCEQVNSRPHRITRRPPVEMLAEERSRLHPLPVHPYTAAFGTTRVVPANTPMVSFEGGSYSVPHPLVGQSVWVRRHGEEVVVVHVGTDGPVEVARHALTVPGQPRVDDAHFPPAPETSLGRTPRARTGAESAFLALGDGAALWLTEAGAAGTTRVRAKMAEAVSLAKLLDADRVGWALGHAAVTGRFGEGDLASILAYQATARPGPTHTASEHRSLAQGTGGWAQLKEATR